MANGSHELRNNFDGARIIPRSILSMNEDDESIMLCVDADTIDKLDGYPANCYRCDKPIWVSHSSAELLTIVTKLSCFECFLKVKPDSFDIAPIEPKQMEDIMRYTGLTKEQVMGSGEILKKIKQMYEEGKVQFSGGVLRRTDEKPT